MERASLENFGIFTFLNCYFFQYFVGTSDILSVQMTCLSSYMYRQISQVPTNFPSTDKFPNVPKKVRKGIIAPLPPPPLWLRANDPRASSNLDVNLSLLTTWLYTLTFGFTNFRLYSCALYLIWFTFLCFCIYNKSICLVLIHQRYCNICF